MRSGYLEFRFTTNSQIDSYRCLISFLAPSLTEDGARNPSDLTIDCKHRCVVYPYEGWLLGLFSAVRFPYRCWKFNTFLKYCHNHKDANEGEHEEELEWHFRKKQLQLRCKNFEYRKNE